MENIAFKDVYEMALRGRDKLLALIQDNGRFVYEYNHKTKMQTDEYNALRHWGSLWSIVTVSDDIGVPLTATQAMKVLRSLNWAIKRFGIKLNRWKGVDYSGNKIPYIAIAENTKIKLGGQGLALLAIATFLEHLNTNNLTILTNDQHISLVKFGEGIYRFTFDQLIYEKNSSYEFIHKVTTEGNEVGTKSNYYVGEVLFGLAVWSCLRPFGVELPAYDNKRPVLTTIGLQLARSSYGVQTQSHWMIYAISYILHEVASAKDLEVIDTLNQYQSALIQHIQLHDDYLKSGSNPISCRTEGVMAAVTWLETTERKSVISRVLQIVEKNLPNQVKYIMNDGAVIGSDKNPNVRIDNIQHCIAGLAAIVKHKLIVFPDSVPEFALVSEVIPSAPPTPSIVTEIDKKMVEAAPQIVIAMLKKSPALRKAVRDYLKNRKTKR